jgi:hypothetical protein
MQQTAMQSMANANGEDMRTASSTCYWQAGVCGACSCACMQYLQQCHSNAQLTSVSPAIRACCRPRAATLRMHLLAAVVLFL